MAWLISGYKKMVTKNCQEMTITKDWVPKNIYK
jgi:hypothetical protein